MHYERDLRHGSPGPARKLNGLSGVETSVAEEVASWGTPVVRGARGLIPSRELDIFLPDSGVAFEINGVYWHSEKFKPRSYHADKYHACREAGIRLVQVWEDDLLTRRGVVMAMMKAKALGSGRPVGARKTELREIASPVARSFLDAYHLQGGAKGSHHLALFYEGEIRAVGTFMKRSEGVVELSRYASTGPTPGALGKMVKALPYGRVVTFADRTVSDGSLYQASGWTHEAELPPDYSYLSQGRRCHKFGYRLKRFREDPDLIFEEGATERELADLNGLLRIWDAGKGRYAINLG